MIIIIAIIFIYIVSILKPITPIIHGMDNLNSSKFIPLNITSNDEFSIMATKVNESSLIFKNELKKLENISKARTQFFSNAAHEFRTPLFLLKGYAETLIDGGINDPKINKTYIQKILQKSIELENIFKQLSDISKIESNEIIIKKEPILLNDILIWIKENFEDLAKQKQIILSIPNNVVLEGDEETSNEEFINHLDLNSTPVHFIDDQNWKSKCFKLDYQNQLLGEVFRNHGMLTPIEFLNKI